MSKKREAGKTKFLQERAALKAAKFSLKAATVIQAVALKRNVLISVRANKPFPDYLLEIDSQPKPKCVHQKTDPTRGFLLASHKLKKQFSTISINIGGLPDEPETQALSVCTNSEGRIITRDIDLLWISKTGNANQDQAAEDDEQFGVSTQHEQDIAEELNEKFKKPLIQHGCENRNPHSDTNTSGKMLHFLKDGSIILTETEEELAEFVLKYDLADQIDIHPNWDKTIWQAV